MADKQNAKLARREKKEERERAKAERTGESPAQAAEKIRQRNAPDPKEADRRAGMDDFVGGDTAG